MQKSSSSGPLGQSLADLKREEHSAELRKQEAALAEKEKRAKELEEEKQKLEELSEVYGRWEATAKMLEQSLRDSALSIQELANGDKTFSEYVTAFCSKYYHAEGIPLRGFEYVSDGFCCANLGFKRVNLFLDKDFNLMLEFDHHEIRHNTKVPTIPRGDFSRSHAGKSHQECAFWHIAKWPDYLVEEICAFLDTLKSPGNLVELISTIDRKVNTRPALKSVMKLHSCWSPPVGDYL